LPKIKQLIRAGKSVGLTYEEARKKNRARKYRFSDVSKWVSPAFTLSSNSSMYVLRAALIAVEVCLSKGNVFEISFYPISGQLKYQNCRGINHRAALVNFLSARYETENDLKSDFA
jgi:hypothetical protein